MAPEAGQAAPCKTGYVAIVGKPNVGKSTLMNRLLDRKLSIVSPKPQTTRHRVLGILNGPGVQIIFLDTPGLIEPKYSLQKTMVAVAVNSLADADLVLVLEDASHPEPSDNRFFQVLKKTAAAKILVLNKVDRVSKVRLLPAMERYAQTALFCEIVPVSALTRDGLDLLLDRIVKHLPEHPPLYPPDVMTDHPERFFAAEIIREAVFLEFGQEIPYATAVLIADFKERPGGKDYIRADIIVEKDSQKGILIGAQGKALKKLGSRSRENIETFLDRPVFLELVVRVEKNWRKNERDVKRFGYA